MLCLMSSQCRLFVALMYVYFYRDVYIYIYIYVCIFINVWIISSRIIMKMKNMHICIYIYIYKCRYLDLSKKDDESVSLAFICSCS